MKQSTFYKDKKREKKYDNRKYSVKQGIFIEDKKGKKRNKLRPKSPLNFCRDSYVLVLFFIYHLYIPNRK